MNKKTISKSQEIYNTLIQEIISGNIYPGQRLVERELIEKYGISKTPIREALNKLTENNIVEYQLNKGFSVVKVSKRFVEEIYELREISEGLAARKIAENKDIFILKEEKIIQNIKLSEECLVDNNIQSYSILDMEFHRLLADMSMNLRLKNLLDNLYYQSRLLLSTSLYLPGRGIEVSLKEHTNILKAIASRNASKSEMTARNHVNNVKIEIFKWISHRSFSSFS